MISALAVEPTAMNRLAAERISFIGLIIKLHIAVASWKMNARVSGARPVPYKKINGFRHLR
jgi:hypothetical protein